MGKNSAYTPGGYKNIPGWARWMALGEAQNWRCCYCGIHMVTEHKHNNQGFSIDHLQAIADGGKRRWSNEVAACKLCNGGRSNVIAPVTYYNLVQRLGRHIAAQVGREQLKARSMREHRERQQRILAAKRSAASEQPS